MPRVAEQSAKIKKKNTLNVPAKKEASPVAEFDTWCNSVLTSWSAKIDGSTYIRCRVHTGCNRVAPGGLTTIVIISIDRD